MRTPTKRTSLRKGPVCSICKHPDRALIEATRVAGASLDSIAAKYGTSRDAIWRHMDKHVPEDVRLQYITTIPIKELAERAATEGVSLLDYFGIVRGVLLQQFQLAASVNDKNGTAVLAGRLTEVLREIGRRPCRTSTIASRSLIRRTSSTYSKCSSGGLPTIPTR
jgi:hypothetical protein